MFRDARFLRAIRTPLFALLVLSLPLAVLAEDVFESYDIDVTEVQNSLMSACQGRFYGFSISETLRALDGAQRAAVVHALGAYARSYVKSPEFKKDYAQAYKNSKPKGFGMPSLDPGALARKAADKMQGKGSGGSSDALDKNPDVTIRRRLEAFLEMSQTVDFDARLNGRQFADPEYEAMSGEWKMCFRAGREATLAAREEAEAWLEELGPAK